MEEPADTDQQEDEAPEVKNGLPVGQFIDSCVLIKEMHADVQNRILQALNINLFNKRAKISWQSFIHFYALLKYCTATHIMFVKFWMNVILLLIFTCFRYSTPITTPPSPSWTLSTHSRNSQGAVSRKKLHSSLSSLAKVFTLCWWKRTV